MELGREEQLWGGGVNDGHIRWCHWMVKLEAGEEDERGILGC